MDSTIIGLYNKRTVEDMSDTLRIESMSKKVTTQTFLLPSASHRVKSNGTLWLSCTLKLKV